MKQKKKLCGLMIAAAVLVCIGLLGAGAVFGINYYVMESAQQYLLTPEEAQQLSDMDCILVLGCQVYENGSPSPMLTDRLKRAVALFQAGVAPKLLMSGDHGQVTYDEVSAMKQYAIDAGAANSDVFMDHAGFSTYESMYRAKEIFQAKKIVIVTQKYHLYRAVYVARSLGIEAYGVASDYWEFSGQVFREIREILARNKDFLTSAFKPYPTYLGEAIPIWGDGSLTNDGSRSF